MNNEGTVAAMTAILAIPLVLSLGLAVDSSCLWLLRQRMQWAVDTAALLGASQANGELFPSVTKDAKELFWSTYGAPSTSSTAPTQVGFLGSSSDGAIVTNDAVAAGNIPTKVTVTASASLPTFLMRVQGPAATTVTVSSTAAIPHRVEMALVLDNSLSMGLAITGANSKLAAMQTAANNLLTTMLGSGSSSSPNVSISIVPFAGAVNVGNGTIGQSFLKSGTLAAKYPSNSSTDRGWRGCVQARAYASGTSYDTTEDAPSSDATKFDPYFYTSTYQIKPKPGGKKNDYYTGDNDWTDTSINDTSSVSQTTNTNYLNPNNQLYYGPNLFCPHSSLIALTNDETALTTSINNMAIVNGGGTIINQGLQWGWFTLSPLWTAWKLPATPTGAARPVAYSDSGTTKIIVLMTDGVSEIDGINSFYAYAANQYTDQHSNCDRVGAANYIYPECIQADTWYNSYKRLSDGVLISAPAANANIDTVRTNAKSTLRTRLIDSTNGLCQKIKNSGIILYTIFFHGTQDDQLLNATSNGAGSDLQTCAKDANHYFDSQSATAINNAFQTIAQSINDLKIIQ